MSRDSTTGASSHSSGGKTMRLRYPGTCRICGRALSAGTRAVYERAGRTVRCVDECSPAPGSPDPETTDAGLAGASARREHARRRARRETQVRTAHPHLGGLILRLTSDPHTTKAWETGAEGEERLGRRLDGLASPDLRVLHDRRIPGTRANIDHLVIGPNGVFVVDAKKYRGRPRLKSRGGIIGPRVNTLTVGKRDCTKLVPGVRRQVRTVRAALDDEKTPANLKVHGVLCFIDADWGPVRRARNAGGVQILWPRRLAARVRRRGPLTRADVELLHGQLAQALPQA
ncbi:MAG: nuclease-related domain-containing protein [Nocardioidaceae bacterium]